MRDKVLAWCSSQRLFAAGERVICAVSGGADSMAMLWCLRSLQSELGITVSAAHFDHRLRGAESDRDARFVRDFCQTHDIPLTLGAADVARYAAETGKSVETAAREKRYAFLEQLDCDKLATAHTADDNAETVLLHLLRGSGLRGLCGIPPQRGRIVRPLLSITREEVEHYLRDKGIAWVEDSTNAETDYARNRLRHRIMPLLRAESPRLSEHLTAQSALLRAEDAFLEEQAAQLLRSAAAGEGEWRCDAFLSAPDVLQKRALRLLLREYLPQDVSLAHIKALQALLAAPSPSARCSLPGGLTASRRYETFFVDADSLPTFSALPLNIPGETRVPALGIRIFCEIGEKNKKYANTPFHFAVKYDMITQSISCVRPRRTGDTLVLPNGHRKTLKKLFIDRKIPRFKRERCAVLATETTVLAVVGVGVNESCKPSAGESAVIIHIQKEEM